jgi:multidrug resistance efflux pump
MPEKKPEHTKEKKVNSRLPLIVAAFIVVVIGGGIASFAYIASSSKTVYIENSKIEAAVVDLSPTTGGTLNAVYVSAGDVVPANTVVATVGTELIKTTNGGLVLTANNNIGKTVSPSDVVVEMIDPSALRVVGQVQEDKGLVDIQTGQRATFTVDAFGSKQFDGIVDEVAPTSESGDVVFSVSDKRAEQNFDVKVRFDTTAHPELKNGMSAKLSIFKTQ